METVKVSFEIPAPPHDYEQVVEYRVPGKDDLYWSSVHYEWRKWEGTLCRNTVRLPTARKKKPIKRVAWVNVYQNSYRDALHPTRQIADKYAGSDRIGCARVEFEKGQFDE